MNRNSLEIDVIVDMHKKGFCDDFLLFGCDLLWVQEGIFIRSGDYNLIVCYEVFKSNRTNPGIILFGVEVISFNVKGILIYHNINESYAPPSIMQKLEELNNGQLKKAL